MTAATCHPDRPAHGRGLCSSCYTRAHSLGLLARYACTHVGVTRPDSVRSIAALVGVSAPTVAKARREGRLSLVNGAWRITPAKIGRPRK